ncbi:hypothetical protein PM082_018239 [Marasmius tenuissimus]|nr:hypothetical protein PM082_018239 [Marasmius tenuissimus]
MFNYLFDRIATPNSPLLPKLTAIVIKRTTSFPEFSDSSYEFSPPLSLLLNTAQLCGLSLNLELYDSIPEVVLVSVAEMCRLRLREGILVTATFKNGRQVASGYEFLARVGMILETVLCGGALSEDCMHNLQSVLCELGDWPTPIGIVKERWDNTAGKTDVSGQSTALSSVDRSVDSQ